MRADDGSRPAPGISVRAAVAADAPHLVAFNQAMAMETEDRALAGDVLARGVDRVLADPGLGFYLIAEVEREVAGALMVTFEWSDWRDGLWFWIQSVYVQPERRRMGVYRRLYDQVRAHALEREDVCGVRLYVESENARAQAVYATLGMRDSNYLVYEEEIVRDA